MTTLTFDQHFAKLIARLSHTTDPEIETAFVRISQAITHQHTCLDLSHEPWLINKLRQLPTVTCHIGNHTKMLNTPLVLWQPYHDDDTKQLLFTQRYFYYETRIAEALIERNRQVVWDETWPTVRHVLDRLFAANGAIKNDVIDWQKIAAYQCLTRQFILITGGPGTGKTTTIVKILAALMQLKRDHSGQQIDGLMIKIATPTGKAAMRLLASIKAVQSQFTAKQVQLPDTVSTLHRLLGARADGTYKYHAKNLLPLDLLILDEVSMIDLAMFYNLLSALPPHSRLILLGDPDQLPSVAPGNLLADIARSGLAYSNEFRAELANYQPIDLPDNQSSNDLLTDARCQLVKSYRFAQHRGIGELARAIRDNQPPATDNSTEVNFIDGYTETEILKGMQALYADYLAAAAAGALVEQLLTLFAQCRLLTPTRSAEFGVESLNAKFEAIIQTQPKAYYHGKPLIVTENNYRLQVFNGDIGICFTRPTGEVQVAFATERGSKHFLPTQLPNHETCFAMTVHKSQGSEFNTVNLVLPRDLQQYREQVSRELLYTGITRSRTKLNLYVKQDYLKHHPSEQRMSGLRYRFLPNTNTT